MGWGCGWGRGCGWGLPPTPPAGLGPPPRPRRGGPGGRRGRPGGGGVGGGGGGGGGVGGAGGRGGGGCPLPSLLVAPHNPLPPNPPPPQDKSLTLVRAVRWEMSAEVLSLVLSSMLCSKP